MFVVGFVEKNGVQRDEYVGVVSFGGRLPDRVESPIACPLCSRRPMQRLVGVDHAVRLARVDRETDEKIFGLTSVLPDGFVLIGCGACQIWFSTASENVDV